MRHAYGLFNPTSGRYDAYIYPACPCEVQVRDVIDQRLKRESDNTRRKAAWPYVPPPRLEDATLDSYHPHTQLQQAAHAACHDYVRTAADRIGRGQGAYLWGATGTGKSHLMVAVGNALNRVGFHVTYYDVTQLLMKLKAASRQLGGSLEGELIQMLCDVDLLLLDDLGKEPGWEEQMSRLHTILNNRVNNMKSTWFTSEMNTSDLARHLGRHANGFMSRLLEATEIFQFDGKDQRILRRTGWKRP